MGFTLKKSVLCTVAALLATSSAFEVNFWLGPECTSESLGTFYESDPSNAACNSIPANAQAATVEKEDADSANDNVEFYSCSNCDSSCYVASSDAGCVDFTAAGGNAIAWQVQNDLSDPGRKKRRSSGVKATVRRSGSWWTAHQESIRSELGLSAEDATGSLSPDWDPSAHVSGGFGHGNVTEQWGRTWKWQQVALGASIGIPIEDWNDAVHTSSDRFIPFGNVDYEAQLLSKRTYGAISSSIEERDLIQKRWNYGQCRALLECGRTFAAAATANLGTGWMQTVQAAYKLKTYGSTFYDWAHAHPFSVSIVIGTGTSAAFYGIGYAHGGATAQDNDQLGDCADDNTQVNSFIQALTSAAGASGKSAAQTDITLDNGHILSISAEVYPKNDPPSPNQCDSDGSSG